MPNIMEISGFAAPELDVFARLTEGQLRSRMEPEKGIFIAESPKVIERALNAGYEPVSLLMERKHIEGQARDILARCGEVPVYTADREVLASLTGYELTRGVLCAMRRPRLPSVEELCAGARRRRDDADHPRAPGLLGVLPVPKGRRDAGCPGSAQRGL